MPREIGHISIGVPTGRRINSARAKRRTLCGDVVTERDYPAGRDAWSAIASKGQFPVCGQCAEIYQSLSKYWANVRNGR